MVTACERRHAEAFAHPVLAIVTGIALRGRPVRGDDGGLSIHLCPWSAADGRWLATVLGYEPAHTSGGRWNRYR
jgi:hypothetical protein